VDALQCTIVADLSRHAEHVATEVRRRRQQRTWTLDVAAARLGVSRRLLAQLEAGQGNPSLSTLLAIAEGFDISLVELLADGDKPAITVQEDNANAPVLWNGPNGGTGRLLLGSDPLELWQWTLEPGEERSSDAHRTGSREVLLVTAGAVTITVGSAEPVTIRRGQSALFRADEPHSYRNDAKAAAAFVLAVHEPNGTTS
jgi:transcriptional regulator with XRE-family HTH domain